MSNMKTILAAASLAVISATGLVMSTRSLLSVEWLAVSAVTENGRFSLSRLT